MDKPHNLDILTCPFCGHMPEDERDFLHPTGTGWREDVLGDKPFRHYMNLRDRKGVHREVHGQVWSLSCLTHEGGCGAEVTGDSREEAIAAWNRRPNTENKNER